MSLLEVLVAAGILVVGLASVAALLPAAGSRFSEAATEDRAGNLAANARHEIMTRGLTNADLFPDPYRAAAFGTGFGYLASVAGGWVNPPANVVQAHIDPTRGFWLEDDLVYEASPGDNAPASTFFDRSSGANPQPEGPRQFRERVCWGAMLVPAFDPSTGTVYRASAGTPATLVVGIFRKQAAAADAIREIYLHAPAIENPEHPGRYLPPGGWFALDREDCNGIGGRPVADRVAQEATRKGFLQPCSWVIMVPTGPGQRPVRLLQINSSWTLRGPGAAEDVSRRSSQVMLRLPDELLRVNPDNGVTAFDPYRTIQNGIQAIRVYGLSNVIRMDQYQITLD